VDHIVQAVLYKHTQLLLPPDLRRLLSSKGKPLITNFGKARLATVWTRLADSLATVRTVADTSMVTIMPEYAGHFYDLYIRGKENAKLKGDRM
jgi:hypothetical protein